MTDNHYRDEYIKLIEQGETVPLYSVWLEERIQALETKLKELDSFKTVCLETCPKRMSEIRKQKNLKTDNERLKEFAQHLETWWND